jgi:hypothetical protein
MSDLDPTGVHALGHRVPAALAKSAAQRGERWIEIDLAAAADRDAALRVLGTALDFPDYYGANLDALADCLSELPDHDASPGWSILLLGFTRAPALTAHDRRALLEIGRDAAEDFAQRGRALRVYYD